MNIINYLYLLLIEPIRLLFEIIFFYAYKLTSSCGLSIVVLSLVVNLLALPLYNRADELQMKARDKEASIRPMADHIKKCFFGDERVMMLQTYYQEMSYSPLNTFKTLTSLLLQIPFFMAAYYFLSELRILQGISLGPIKDLAMPDALITIGSVSINFLPILMTVINIISSFIYSSKEPLKEKLKLILVAVVFLFLLYGSPSGLVFYWTLNNVFSLVKNIILLARKPSLRKKDPHSKKDLNNGKFILLISCTVLTILTGIMIPADVVSENPAELINTLSATPHTPVLYILSSALIAAGAFLIWIPVFYYLAGDRNKRNITLITVSWALIGIANYVFFNVNFGLLSRKLIYDHKMTMELGQMIINLLVDIMIIAVAVLILCRKPKIIKAIASVIAATIAVLSFTNIVLIFNVASSQDYDYHQSASAPSATLTTTGQNVILIMMDRMMGSYIPYLFNERPDLIEKFDGFVFYPNTISFGSHTNFGSPALYGGYEYTPYNLNARSDELLVDKHNEALRVLPTIFADNGWNVSVGDPSYANYEWIPDVSIYDDNPDINAFRLSGMFNDRNELLINAGDEIESRLNRNLFCFGVMKTLPLALQPGIYMEGSYCQIDLFYDGYVDDTYAGTTPHTQRGLFETYVEEFTALQSLDEVVEVNDDPRNCFFMFANNTAHEITLLEEPSYLPAVIIDNTEYDAAHEDRFILNGVEMHMDTDFQDYPSYQCNMAALIALGEWFDYLRDNGLYDNSRIILVADHGFGLSQFDDLLVPELDFDAQWVNPVLMIKDFGSNSEFSTCNDFMTNADTPYIAVNGLIPNPTNPFTGNPITLNDKTDDQLIYMSEEWNVNTNNGTQYVDPDGYWLTVRNNIWDDENWSSYDYTTP